MDVFKRIKLTKLCYSYVKFQPCSPLEPVPHHVEVLNLFTGLAVDQAFRLQVAAPPTTPSGTVRTGPRGTQ